MEKNSMQVQMTEKNPLTLMESFFSCDFHNILLNNLTTNNFFNLTPIQKFALPIVMSGKDFMANGPTGCGKTVAYCVSILHYLMVQQSELIFDENHCEPHVIIMTPKNEFVYKVCNLLHKFKRNTHIKFSYLYEGKDVIGQRSVILENGNHIIVATPRSLKKCVDSNFVSLKSVKILVLDKADIMFDMGFTSDIEQLLKHPTMTSNDIRQTLIFSATFLSELQYMATVYLKPDYTFFGIGDVGATCKDVEQSIQEVKKCSKKNTLLNLLKKMEDGENAIVFVQGQHLADYLASYCCEMDIPATSIHEDREKTDQEEALNNFKTNKIKVLISTSVLAKGLDIKGVNYVVNYDLPKNIGEFIHRIGCSGRLGNVGKAVSFFDPECDGPIASELIKILQQTRQEIPIWLCHINNDEIN